VCDVEGVPLNLSRQRRRNEEECNETECMRNGRDKLMELPQTFGNNKKLLSYFQQQLKGGRVRWFLGWVCEVNHGYTYVISVMV